MLNALISSGYLLISLHKISNILFFLISNKLPSSINFNLLYFYPFLQFSNLVILGFLGRKYGMIVYKVYMHCTPTFYLPLTFIHPIPKSNRIPFPESHAERTDFIRLLAY